MLGRFLCFIGWHSPVADYSQGWTIGMAPVRWHCRRPNCKANHVTRT